MESSNKHYLRSLVSRLKKAGWLADKLDFDDSWFSHNTYLIRFGHPEAYNLGSQPLLLMGDFGITWEPAKAYPTEAFGYIDGEDPDQDVAEMIQMAKDYYLTLGYEVNYDEEY